MRCIYVVMGVCLSVVIGGTSLGAAELGPELITNGDIEAGATSWTDGSVLDIVDEGPPHNKVIETTDYRRYGSQKVSVVNGARYQLQFDRKDIAHGGRSGLIINGATVMSASPRVNQLDAEVYWYHTDDLGIYVTPLRSTQIDVWYTQTIVLQANGSSIVFTTYPAFGCSTRIDNVSLKEILQVPEKSSQLPKYLSKEDVVVKDGSY